MVRGALGGSEGSSALGDDDLNFWGAADGRRSRGRSWRTLLAASSGTFIYTVVA